VCVAAIYFMSTHAPEEPRGMSSEYQKNRNAGFYYYYYYYYYCYYYYYYYLLQLSFHSVEVVLTLLTNNKYT